MVNILSKKGMHKVNHIRWDLKRILFNNLSSVLVKHEKLYYIWRVVKYANDGAFRKHILNLYHDENAIQVEENSEVDNERSVYAIKINQNGMGMGAFIRWALHGLWESKKMGVQSVIYFSGPYSENHKINGTDNMFEYYFEQPSSIKYHKYKEASRVYFFDEGTLKRFATRHNMSKRLLVGYDISEKYIVEMSELFTEYIKLNERTKQYIEKGINTLGIKNKNYIGVHIRGTDYKLKWKNHPNALNVEQYFSEIDKLLDDECDGLFVATDDLGYLERFQERYGSHVVFYEDVHRGTDLVNVAMTNTDRENSHYYDGLEIIRDIYTLSYCKSLVVGLSQVSVCARIIQESRFHKDKRCIVLSNGIYK